MNITAEFKLPSMIYSRDIEHNNITLRRLLQFIRSFKHDDINKSSVLLSDEHTCLKWQSLSLDNRC